MVGGMPFSKKNATANSRQLLNERWESTLLPTTNHFRRPKNAKYVLQEDRASSRPCLHRRPEGTQKACDVPLALDRRLPGPAVAAEKPTLRSMVPIRSAAMAALQRADRLRPYHRPGEPIIADRTLDRHRSHRSVGWHLREHSEERLIAYGRAVEQTSDQLRSSIQDAERLAIPRNGVRRCRKDANAVLATCRNHGTYTHLPAVRIDPVAHRARPKVSAMLTFGSELQSDSVVPDEFVGKSRTTRWTCVCSVVARQTYADSNNRTDPRLSGQPY